MTESSSGSSGGFLAWFPRGKQDAPGWKFDVITLLAIIGEGSVADHAQTISASALCLLPRIIPAPQALLKPNRPQRLPEVTAKISGVYGGVVLDTVGFFANIIHPLEDLKPFAFRVLEIKHKHLVEPHDSPPPSRWRQFGWSNIRKNRPAKSGKRPTNPAGTGIGSSLLLERRTGEKQQHKQKQQEESEQNGGFASHDDKSRPRQPLQTKTSTLTLTGDPNHIVKRVKTESSDANHITTRHKEDNTILTPITPTQPQPRPQTCPLQSTTTPNITILNNNNNDNNNDNNNNNNNSNNNNNNKPTSYEATSLTEEGLAPRALQKAPTMSEKFSDMLTNPTMVNSADRYTVPPTFYSPLHIISILSFLLTIALITAAWFWEDGTAIVAIVLVSVASSVVGYASYWRPLLMNRRTTNKVPRGDVVIRTREGAFVLVKCTEEVARELYSGTEECQYVSRKFYRAYMGLGMVLLMVAVVLLGNCGWASQAFIGASYIVLNGVYWALGLLPHEYFWDLRRYVCEDITPEDALHADEHTSTDPREGTPSFTRTLWYAIRETKYAAWVDRSGALPGTEQWRRWRDEAVRAARRGNREWKAVGRKNEIMKEDLVTGGAHCDREGDREDGEEDMVMIDEAEQRAPLTEVQPVRVGTFS